MLEVELYTSLCSWDSRHCPRWRGVLTYNFERRRRDNHVTCTGPLPFTSVYSLYCILSGVIQLIGQQPKRLEC